MWKRLLLLILAIACLFGAAGSADACTCFFAANKSAALFARNYDWHLEHGVLTVNKRGIQKTAFSFGEGAEWTSRFGSVTFNQYGREFPNDGMNEAGLVVAVMWLNETRYPKPDARPTVGSAQWVQYQLDTAATVADVLASDGDVRIEAVGGGLVHYLVADATGACAAIEWVDGKRIIHTGKDMIAKALTNNTYARSLDHLKRHEGFGGDAKPKYTRASLDRFVRAAMSAKAASGSKTWSGDEAFTGLADAAQGSRTKWSIVYDARRLAVAFKTQSSQATKRLEFGDLDFSPGQPVQVLNLADATAENEIVDQLTDYSADRNLREINTAFDATGFLKPMPAVMRQQVASYPDRLCHPAVATQPVAAGSP